ASHTHDADASGVYQEACRLIRVDGIVRVASDSYNDYFNLLETANNADDPPPSAAATANYQSLVLDYLRQRIVNAGSGYNTPPGSGAVSSLETTHSINNPGSINIDKTNTVGKYLHTRGLYFDILEQDALDVISDAKANCDTTATTLEA